MSTPAQVVQRGCGKGRDPWSIRRFLDEKALNMSCIATMAKTYPQVAQETIRGTRNHKRVLEQLEKLGCPKEYLYGSKKQGRVA